MPLSIGDKVVVEKAECGHIIRKSISDADKLDGHESSEFILRTGGDFVFVDDYGAVGDGATDDSSAFGLGMAALGSTGGTLLINNNKKYLIDNEITVLAGCSIRGSLPFPGTLGNNSSAPYSNYGSTLILNSSARIVLNSSASLSQLIVYRKGMTFPSLNEDDFTGTCVEVYGDDTHLSNCMILGFHKALNSSGWQRVRCENVYVDCENGFNMDNSWDINYLDNCHCWPFATIEHFMLVQVPLANYGSQAIATANVTSGAVTSITINDAGNAYNKQYPPSIILSGGGGTGATATASLTDQEVVGIAVSAGGSGYTSAPTVTISGGGGSGATATAVIASGAVTSFTMTAKGTGYTSAPTIELSGGGGTGAAGTGYIGYPIGSIAVTNGGSGYTSAPDVAITYYPIIERSGTGYNFTTVADWAKVTNCFAYAYLNDFHVDGVNSVTFNGCAADSTPTRGDRVSAGFSLTGSATEIRMIGCQSGGHRYGIFVETSSKHVPTFIADCTIWSCNNGVYVNDGDIAIVGGSIRDCVTGTYILGTDSDLIAQGITYRNTTGQATMTNGIYIDTLNCRATIDGCTFKTINGSAIYNKGSPGVFIGQNIYEDLVYKAVHQAADPSIDIASAASLTLNKEGAFFNITGNTNIGAIYGGWYGRVVTLKFENVLTVNDTAVLNLRGNYTASDTETLTLVAVGDGEWYEISRSSSIVLRDGANIVTEVQIIADHIKLATIESGSTSDLTGNEIVTLINACPGLIDDNNIAASISRDSELASHAGSASVHHSSTSNALNITPSKINCADIRNPSGAAMAFRTSGGNTHFYSGDDTNGVTFARHVRPYSDNAYVMGDASHRWSLVRGVTVTSGDLGFEETTCPKCGKSFEIGDTLILVVKSLHEYGTLTIPMHLQCVGLSPVGISLPVPQMRDEWVMEGKELKTIRVPDTEMITKTILKTRPHFEFVNGINIQHHPILDTKTGKFKLKGKIISKNRATQLVDETVEVPIYKDVRIVI